jgi:hypothetical protein
MIVVFDDINNLPWSKNSIGPIVRAAAGVLGARHRQRAASISRVARIGA